MEKSIGLSWLGMLLLCLFLPGTERNPPLFCALDTAWAAGEIPEQIGAFSNKDTLLEHPLYLLSDTLGQPQLFYADVLTPVCIDGICKPVFIELYWDLTGSYAGYGVYADKPLTKFDHDEFLPEDHEKLDRLLADNNSVLRRKELSDLFDERAAAVKKIEYQGEKLDAVSGATKKEIKESIVEGALYSCYTLWHLIHGEASKRIEHYLDSIYSKTLEKRFLSSDHEPYRYYALQSMPPADFMEYSEQLAAIFANARPLTRTYMLKKMPEDLLGAEAICRQFYRYFSVVDINTKTLLIDRLPGSHPIALELLSTAVEAMTANQLKSYLDALSAAGSIGEDVLGILERSAQSTEYAYSYLITQWLADR